MSARESTVPGSDAMLQMSAMKCQPQKAQVTLLSVPIPTLLDWIVSHPNRIATQLGKDTPFYTATNASSTSYRRICNSHASTFDRQRKAFWTSVQIRLRKIVHVCNKYNLPLKEDEMHSHE